MSEPNQFDFLKDLPQTEIPKFSAEQMVVCTACQRNNPPTRMDCLYCGKDLEITDENAKFVRLHLQKPETWENGFNVIWSAQNSNEIDFETRREIAEIFGFEPPQFSKLIDANPDVPLVRLDSMKSAEVALRRLHELNFKATIVSDLEFEMEKLPKRLKSIEFEDEKILLFHFNNDQISEIEQEDINLIVVGFWVERKIELSEQRQKGKENKTLASSAMSNDEMIIDIYSKTDSIGWRVIGRGFDFSCLAEKKTFIVKENMQKLSEILSVKATEAFFDTSYLNLREALGAAWELDETTSSKGWQKKSFGGFETENAITSSNLSQFTKYSRLLRKLKLVS